MHRTAKTQRRMHGEMILLVVLMLLLMISNGACSFAPSSTQASTERAPVDACDMVLTKEDVPSSWPGSTPRAVTKEGALSACRVEFSQTGWGSSYALPSIQNTVAVYPTIDMAEQVYLVEKSQAQEKVESYIDLELDYPSIGDECFNVITSTGPIKLADVYGTEQHLVFRKSNIVVWLTLGWMQFTNIEAYAKVAEGKIRGGAPPENEPPVASFTYSPDFPSYSGGFVSLDASNSYDPEGGELTYQWDFQDGETDTGCKVTHQFRGVTDRSKTYTVTLTVKDDQGATDQYSAEITVRSPAELRESINSRLYQKVVYPPYCIDTHFKESWWKFTELVTRSDATARYDELYWAAIDYDHLRFNALIKARDCLDSGDIASAQKYLEKSDTYANLYTMAAEGANDYFIGQVEAGEIIAKGIKDACEASVKFGLGVTNPTAAKAADYIYLAVDYGVDRAVLGEDEAAKNAIVKMAVMTLFNEVPFEELGGGRTISDYTKNRIGKVTFPMLQKAFRNNEQAQFILSKAIKEAGVEDAEDVATWILNGLEKGVNLERIEARSPVDLRVYDSQGQATGLINGEVKHEIPRSVYNNGTILIFSPTDSYSYEVAGTDEGTYGLEVTCVEEGQTSSFSLADVPTSANAVHQYAIDWDTLSQGGKGVTMKIDSDGDGVFEETRYLGYEEEMPWFWIVIGVVAALVAALLVGRRIGKKQAPKASGKEET